MERLEVIFEDESQLNVAKGILHTLETDRKPVHWLDLFIICSYGKTETYGRDCSRAVGAVLKDVVSGLKRGGYVTIHDKQGEKMQPGFVGDLIQLTEEAPRFIEENYPRVVQR